MSSPEGSRSYLDLILNQIEGYTALIDNAPALSILSEIQHRARRALPRMEVSMLATADESSNWLHSIQKTKKLLETTPPYPLICGPLLARLGALADAAKAAGIPEQDILAALELPDSTDASE